MKVLVIGNKGQLGSDMARVLSEANYEVISLGHAQLEITSQAEVAQALREICPAAVVNCASFVRVDESECRPDVAFSVNSVGALNVAMVCAELAAACVYISTDYVFGGDKRTPYIEEDAPNPLNVYGVSKLAGEYFMRNVCAKHYVVRTSGLYGAVGSSGKGGNFVETMIRLAEQDKSIRVVNDQILTPTYTKDLAHKIKELLETDAYGLYHVTNAGSCSWYEFAQKIFDFLGLKPDCAPTTTESYGAKARRPAYSILEHGSLRRLGLGNMRSWVSALEAYLQEKGYLAT